MENLFKLTQHEIKMQIPKFGFFVDARLLAIVDAPASDTHCRKFVSIGSQNGVE